jgi:hypothetical protein
VHAHLDIFLDGVPVIVASGVGINIDDPEVKSGPDGRGGMSYGGIEGCAQPCISPLHTHATDGVLHTETKTPAPNTLGQFFVEWNVALAPARIGEYHDTKTEIAFYVDGEAFDGDPGTIELSDGREIAIVIGTAPDEIPSQFQQ